MIDDDLKRSQLSSHNDLSGARATPHVADVIEAVQAPSTGPSLASAARLTFWRARCTGADDSRGLRRSGGGLRKYAKVRQRRLGTRVDGAFKFEVFSPLDAF